jgi:hypothetical protein
MPIPADKYPALCMCDFWGFILTFGSFLFASLFIASRTTKRHHAACGALQGDWSTAKIFLQ